VAESDKVDLDYVATEIVYDLADLYKALALATGCAGLLERARSLESAVAKREVDTL
jgi:hypothetical protein